MDEEEMNEEQDNQADEMAQGAGQELLEGMEKNVSRFAREKLTAQAKVSAAKHSLLKVIYPILLKIGLIVIIIVFTLSVVMFLISMPGMSMEKLKELFAKFGNAINSFFGGDTTAMVTDSEIYEVLNYLETMGYAEDGGLKGSGYLTKFWDESSTSGSGSYVIENNVQGDGVVRDEDDKIIKAESDYIKIYIMSNNYIYTIKNRNMVASNLFEWFHSLREEFENRVQEFGKGMLMFYYEATDSVATTDDEGNRTTRVKGVIGRRGPSVEFGPFEFMSRTKINVDTEKKVLKIEDSDIFDPNHPMEFSIDGWTGRYGMPLEFLLSIHQATYMPDLAVDLFTSFPTNVNIYLHKVTGTANVYYETPDGNKVTYIEIDKILWNDNARKTYNGNGPFPSGKYATDVGLPVGEEYNDGCKCNTPDCYNASGRCYFLCEICRKRLEAIRDILKAYSEESNNEDNYKTYQPYIASVTDHWYRNVYFVLDSREHITGETNDPLKWNDSINFIDYDYEYETIYKERWTLYETWEEEDGHPELVGYMKLYDIDENGNYNSSPETDISIYEAGGVIKDEQGKVIKRYTKKAITLDGINYSSLFSSPNVEEHPLTDLGWVYNNKYGIWSAYDEGDVSDTFGGQVQTLPIPESESCNDDDKERFKLELKLKEGVIQVGEGQRGETNPTIKNIFLNNKYFKYDGTKERAEIITKLRKTIKSDGTYYTAVEDRYMDNSISFDANGTGESTEYKVSEYVDKAEITEESLNAFSMLENTHTLDADYIYRDFKELIVELGYFSKSDLTDETPKLLQWLVPETGSNGFPKRSIDKKENKMLTLIHSEGDMHAKNLMLAKELQENSEESDDEDERGASLKVKNTDKLMALNTSGLTKIRGEKNNKFALAENVDFTDGMTTNINDTVGATGESSGTRNPSEVSVEELLAAAKKVHAEMEKADEDWEYCAAGVHNGDANRHTQHTTYVSLAAAKSGDRTSDCSSYVSWVLQEVGILPSNKKLWTGTESGGESEGMYTYFADYLLKKEDAGELKPGDILIYGHSADNAHVQINGEKTDSGFIQYNAGSTEAIQSAPHVDDWMINEYTHVIRFNLSNNGTANNYTGYKGNEAVVSPVTGILIEYGTYGPDEEDGEINDDMDNITGEKYRTNLDYTYSSTGDEKDAKAVVDRVGYAKILVLDKTIYSNLEKQFINNNQVSTMKDIDNKSYDSFIDENTGNYKEMKISEDFVNGQGDYEGGGWSAEQKNLYGYKEFAESYEKYGIAGYTIYIDGFIREYPEKIEEEEDTGDTDDTGDPITLDTFKEIKYGDLRNYNSSEDEDGGDGEDEEENVKSLYEKDPDYNVASKTLKNRMNAEAMLKDEAVPTYYTEDNITLKLESDGGTVTYEGIFIKEGTVIGRTMTDKELIKEIREEKYGKYRELREEKTEHTAWMPEPESTSEPKIIGNYLSIKMSDKNKNPIENVEDYMKLDDGEGSSNNNTDLDKITNDSPVEDKIKALMGYLISQGFSEESAAGVLGNLLQESGSSLNTLADNRSHFGLCQWSYSGSPEEPTDGRWKKVLDWAKSQGYTYDSFAGQGRGICESPDAEGYADVISRTKSASTLAEATEIWCKEYEVPGNYDVEVPNRTRKAEAALRVYKGEDSTYTER